MGQRPDPRLSEAISEGLEVFLTASALDELSAPRTSLSASGFNPTNVKRRLLSELRLLPELYTLTFEQINHLWGTLGGKQSPFVLYKVRLVKVQSLMASEAPLIETINTDLHGIDSNLGGTN